MLDTGVSRAIDDAVEARADELTELVREWVMFDTTSVDLEPGSAHTENEEGALQALIADRLSAIGAAVDSFEPDPVILREHPMMPPWHHWAGRPMTVATIRGDGDGRSLIVNGHIDVVAAGAPQTWTSPAFAAEVRDGRIYGRGACDMKGGLAAALVAIETLRSLGVRLAGDLIFQAVTDEETCAMGTVACIERGYRADAGLVPEPTGLNLWIATRGLLHGTVHVPGRSAHAEMRQRAWRQGGGVNAIRATTALLCALRELELRWEGRADKHHPLLSVPEAQPTRISGGTFISNVPESCTIAVNATYLPGEADSAGYGSAPRDEIERALREAADPSGWLAAHPVEFSWATDYPPSEIPIEHAVVAAARAVGAELGREVRPVGIDTTFDGALLTVLGDTVSPALGPGNLDRAHAPDEWIGIAELTEAARLYARLIVDWCGTA